MTQQIRFTLSHLIKKNAIETTEIESLITTSNEIKSHFQLVRIFSYINQKMFHIYDDQQHFIIIIKIILIHNNNNNNS